MSGSLTPTEFLTKDIITENATLVRNMVQRLENNWGQDIPDTYLEFMDNLAKFSSVPGKLLS